MDRAGARKKKVTATPVTHSNIAVIFSILAAAASVVWGASKIDSRVADIEKWIVANADTQIKLVQAQDHAKTLEDNQHKIMNHLDELDLKLERHK